jgi:peptidoglycan/LPS O-acetylase OafA/YrhL
MPQTLPSHHLVELHLEKLDKPIRGHIAELDSLRGIAAVFVLFDHFTRLWRESPSPSWAAHLHFPVIANGRAAVTMFFALSGFVLTLPFLKTRQQIYPIYAIRRVCRIYLPYAVALLFAILACWKFHGVEMYGKEFNATWRSSPSIGTVTQHLLLVGKFNAYAFNPPMWSLVHEMRISLIFPLLCLVSLRRRGLTALTIALMFPLLAVVLQRLSGTQDDAVTGPHSVAWLRTLGFCGTFLVGSILARHQEAIRVHLSRTPRLLRWFLIAAAVVLYVYSEHIPVSAHLQDFATGVGSCYVILLSTEERGPFSRLLQLKPFLFLGRISYSLYLVHLPILMMLSIGIYGKLSYGYLFLPFFALALIAATLFNRLVEVPSIRLGKLIGASAPSRYLAWCRI